MSFIFNQSGLGISHYVFKAGRFEFRNVVRLQTFIYKSGTMVSPAGDIDPQISFLINQKGRIVVWVIYSLLIIYDRWLTHFPGCMIITTYHAKQISFFFIDRSSENKKCFVCLRRIYCHRIMFDCVGPQTTGVFRTIFGLLP